MGTQEQDLLVAAITSRIPSDLLPTDLQVSAEEQRGAGLPKRSIVKVTKIFTLHERLVRGRLGAFPAPFVKQIVAALSSFLQRQHPG